MLFTFMSIGCGAMMGAFLRWFLGMNLNSIFPPIPLGTLASNLIGGFLMGLFIAITRNNSVLSETVRLGITTGFLGGLTTFSTFSAETVNLIAHQEYLLSSAIIGAHVIGSIAATILGIYTVKLFSTLT